MTIDELREESIKVNRRIYGLLAAFEQKTGVRIREVEIRRSRVTRVETRRRIGDIEFIGVKVELGTYDGDDE